MSRVLSIGLLTLVAPLLSCHSVCELSYTGTDTCSRLKNAFEDRCPTTGFDCKKFVEPGCHVTQSFCQTEIDACITKLKQASDCTATLKVTCDLLCFDP
jgi:hypothetical protein